MYGRLMTLTGQDKFPMTMTVTVKTIKPNSQRIRWMNWSNYFRYLNSFLNKIVSLFKLVTLIELIPNFTVLIGNEIKLLKLFTSFH